MLKRIWKLLVLGLIVAAAIGFIIQNLSPLTVQIAPSKQFEARSGVVMLAFFVLGMLATIFFWVASGIRSYFRERSLLSKEKKRQAFYQDQLEARAHLATGNFRKAVDCWEAILRRDAKNVVARVELSKALESLGKPEEALRIIEEGRAAQIDSQELYFRAAELHARLKNPTAGLDNIRLALSTQASAPAAELARDFSLALGKYEEALAYHEQAKELGAKGEAFEQTGAEVEKACILATSPEVGTRILGLRKLLKRHPANISVLSALIETIESTGNITEAAQVYIDLAKKENSSRSWLSAMNFWLRNREPARALSLGNSALRHLPTADKLELDISLAALLFQAGKLSETREKLDAVAACTPEDWAKLSEETKLRYLMTQAALAQRSGAALQCSRYLEVALSADLAEKPAILSMDQETLGQGVQGQRTQAPALQLSTP